jgi:imidazolonepropionase-like amidohydrolase
LGCPPDCAIRCRTGIDLLLVKGDPIANIKLVEDPAKNFVVIMKDGKVYKNLLR